MAYVNFKEERYKAKKQLQNRRENNKQIFDKLMVSKQLPKCYNPDKEYSYREFDNKHFGAGRIQEEEKFEVVSNKDIVCTIFERCTFSNLEFKECNFIGCIFNNCNFESGGVSFKNCCFYKEESEKKPSLNRRDNFSCEFNNCELYVKFDGCTISFAIFDNLLLHNTSFMLTDMTSIIMIDSELKEIRIEDCDLSGAKIMSTYIVDLEFTDKVKTKLDEKTFFDKIEFRKKDKAEYEGIYMTYETIADKFKDNNLVNNFGEYYYLCKVVQRKTLDFWSKVYSYLYWASCGYGERPLYAMFFDLAIIVVFGVIYLLIGIKVDEKIISYIFNGIYGYNIIDIVKDFKEAITYSIDLFTGIGSSNTEVIYFTFIFSNLEKLLGVICMGIGIGTIVRKIIR